jgi:hypothetical protein
MSIYDEMDEVTRDDLHAAAEQLERMNVSQLDVLAEDVQTFTRTYQPSSDMLRILFGIDSNHGIKGWELTHRRATNDRTSVTNREVDDIETLDTVTRGTFGFGTQVLNLAHPPGEPLDSLDVIQGIYDTLVYLIGVDDQTLFMVTTPPAEMINIEDSPATDTDVLNQQGLDWEDSIVITEEMREPDPENQIEQVPRRELPQVLADVDGAVPMSRFECDKKLTGCAKSPVNTREERQELSHAQYEEVRKHLVIAEGEQARGITVIKDAVTGTEEEWDFAKIFHPECGPVASKFEAGEAGLALRRSKGKDEVYIEGTIKYGEPPSPNAEFPHQPVYFDDITVLGRHGEFTE